MKKLGVALLVVALLGGGYYYYHTQLSSSFLDQKKITVRGTEYETWPEEARRRAGIKLRRIPDGSNAAVLYVEASNVFHEPHGGDAVAWVGQNEECLRLLHKAVRRRKCEFPICGPDHTCIYSTALPFPAALRRFSALLASEGERYEKNGEYGKALECYFDITPLSEHLCESNPLLLTWLTTLACQTIRDRAVEECLSSPGPDEDDIRAVIDRYTDASQRCPSFLDAVASKKRALHGTLDVMMGDPAVAEKVFAFMGGPPPGAGAQALSEHGSELRQELDRSLDRLTQWGNMPAWTALRPENSFKAYLSSLPDTCFLSKMWLPDLADARKKFTWEEAQDQGILIFAAIKLYEKKHGRPPAALSELKGDYLSELPKDPFSGRDYVYKVHANGTDWILYSVWENLADDGGAGSWPHKLSKDTDLIWRNTPIPVDAR